MGICVGDTPVCLDVGGFGEPWINGREVLFAGVTFKCGFIFGFCRVLDVVDGDGERLGEGTFVVRTKGCLTITGTSGCPGCGDECFIDTTCECCGDTYTEADADADADTDDNLIGTVEGLSLIHI